MSIRHWKDFLAPPEPAMRTLAGESERTLSWARVVIVLLLLTTPVYKIIAHPGPLIYVWGLSILGVALVIALSILLVLQRFGYHPWMGTAFSTLDGSFVTVALASFMLVQNPLTGLNSLVTFEVYFLVLAATALRFDPRAVLFTGLMITLQYAGLWMFAMYAWDLDAPDLLPPNHRSYQWFDQLTRVLMLLCATLLSLLVTVRTGKLATRSIRDGLTGCFTRGYFDSHARNELARVRRDSEQITLVMIDVDHFKQINDQFGHPVGDQVLRALGTLMQEQIRGGDMIARYGGEEFILVFPESPALIRNRIEDIRRNVERQSFGAGRKRLRVTISAGMSAYPEDGDDIERLVEVADARLLKAKARGRNKVVSAGPGSVE